MQEFHTHCLVCASDKLKPLKAYTRHHLTRCSDCRFVFAGKKASEEVLTSFYSKYSYNTRRKISPITVQRYHELLDEFEKYRKTNRILDVGCGGGWFLEEAQKRGWEVYGTEYSEAAVKICREVGLDVRQGALSSVEFGEGSFDVITSFEVIEHIDNPLEDMEYINRFLRKGGLFYCTTPNFNGLLRYFYKADYNIINFPEHLSYYTSATFDRLMKNTGFRKRRLLTSGISLDRLTKSIESRNFIKTQKDAADSQPKRPSGIKQVKDEQLRQQIEKKGVLKLAKWLGNEMFRFSGTGATIKAWYEKVG